MQIGVVHVRHVRKLMQRSLMPMHMGQGFSRRIVGSKCGAGEACRGRSSSEDMMFGFVHPSAVTRRPRPIGRSRTSCPHGDAWQTWLAAKKAGTDAPLPE